MASDRSQYKSAVDKWTNFEIEGRFSVPSEEGIVAIVTSNYPYCFIRHRFDDDYDASDALKEDTKDWAELNEEASDIAQSLGALGVATELAINSSADDVVDLIKDPHVSDMVFIAHGALAGFFVRGAKDDFFDWKQASEHSTHLKLGSVTQRHCGIQPRDFNAPLGTFLVNDMSKVRAARGKIFSPKGIECPDNDMITPVFSFITPPSYEWLKTNFVNKKSQSPSPAIQSATIC